MIVRLRKEKELEPTGIDIKEQKMTIAAYFASIKVSKLKKVWSILLKINQQANKKGAVKDVYRIRQKRERWSIEYAVKKACSAYKEPGALGLIGTTKIEV